MATAASIRAEQLNAVEIEPGVVRLQGRGRLGDL